MILVNIIKAIVMIAFYCIVVLVLSIRMLAEYSFDRLKAFDAWFTRKFGWFFTNGNKAGKYE